MMRLNNKGQSLVLFILLIPIILGIMALVFDLGNALVKKNEIDNVIEMVLESDLKNTDKDGESLNSVGSDIRKEAIEVLLAYNLNDVDTIVVIDGDVVTITGETYVEGIFSNILSIKGFKVISEYKGYLESTDIEKIK